MQTYRRVPLQFCRFIQYAPPSRATTVHQPAATVEREVSLSSIDDLIRRFYPLMPRGEQKESSVSASSSSIKTSNDSSIDLLHSHFDIQRQSITREFFRHCAPTTKGITNYDDRQNAALNASLRQVVEDADLARLLVDEQQQKNKNGNNGGSISPTLICELGAGTGRLVPLLSALFFDPARRDATNFLFCEQDERLRLVLDAAVRRLFGPRDAGTAIARVSPLDAQGLISFRLEDEIKRQEEQQEKQRQEQTSISENTSSSSSSVLVMSGVAQYLSDWAIEMLLQSFDKVVVQEDVVLLDEGDSNNGQKQQQEEQKQNSRLGIVYHERDASVVRSPAYFEEIFQSRNKKVLASSVHDEEGCVTQTWALASK